MTHLTKDQTKFIQEADAVSLKRTKKCSYCGTSFVSLPSANQRFCSNPCKNRTHIKWKENWTPAKVRSLNTPCWDCVSHVGSKYPYIVYNKKLMPMHRFLFFQLFGEVPSDIFIRHKCDNQRCINPEHLEPGTHQDNIMDAVKRNRTARGEKSGGAKLTEANIFQIRKLLLGGNLTQAEIAKKFKVTRYCISLIKRKKRWVYLA